MDYGASGSPELAGWAALPAASLLEDWSSRHADSGLARLRHTEKGQMAQGSKCFNCVPVWLGFCQLKLIFLGFSFPFGWERH